MKGLPFGAVAKNGPNVEIRKVRSGRLAFGICLSRSRAKHSRKRSSASPSLSPRRARKKTYPRSMASLVNAARPRMGKPGREALAKPDRAPREQRARESRGCGESGELFPDPFDEDKQQCPSHEVECEFVRGVADELALHEVPHDGRLRAQSLRVRDGRHDVAVGPLAADAPAEDPAILVCQLQVDLAISGLHLGGLEDLPLFDHGDPLPALQLGALRARQAGGVDVRRQAHLDVGHRPVEPRVRVQVLQGGSHLRAPRAHARGRAAQRTAAEAAGVEQHGTQREAELRPHGAARGAHKNLCACSWTIGTSISGKRSPGNALCLGAIVLPAHPLELAGWRFRLALAALQLEGGSPDMRLSFESGKAR